MKHDLTIRPNILCVIDTLVSTCLAGQSGGTGMPVKTFLHDAFMITRVFLVLVAAAAPALAADPPRYDYRVLASNRTSTMEREMNEAADAGYRFMGVMGGETGFGGNEVVVVMGKDLRANDSGRKEYKLLATSRTGTMRKEIQQAGEEGFEYLGQTVFESTFGGREVSVILERVSESPAKHFKYRLLSTSKTSTMQKELRQAGDEGFEFLGMTVGKTAFGGSEIVCFLRRKAVVLLWPGATNQSGPSPFRVLCQPIESSYF